MGFIRYISVFAALFVTLVASADISQRACSSQFKPGTGETTIYRSRIMYDSNQYAAVISNINRAASLVGAPVQNTRVIQAGARTMLVVGDMQSEFAYQEMRLQEQNVFQTVFAAGTEGTERYARRYSARFPENFASALPQNLDLVDPTTNQRIQFHEIIAFFEVSFILESGSDAEVKATLTNLIEHLEQGGTLRIFPYNQARMGRIQGILDQIQSTTHYRFQNWVLEGIALPDTRDQNVILRRSSALIIQRGPDAN